MPRPLGTPHFRVPDTGLRVTVPANAFGSRSLEFRVRARAGKLVPDEFEPHGAAFKLPIQMS